MTVLRSILRGLLLLHGLTGLLALALGAYGLALLFAGGAALTLTLLAVVARVADALNHPPRDWTIHG